MRSSKPKRRSVRRSPPIKKPKPSSRQRLFERATAMRRQGDLRRAEEVYRTILKADPHDLGSLHNLGEICIQQCRHDEAIELMREAVRLDPNVAELHNNLGAALRDLGRWTEAEACYREALRLKPDLAEAHNNLGVALKDLGRLAEAEACFNESLRLKPGRPAVRLNRARAYLARGDFENGWREYESRWLADGHPKNYSQPLWIGQEIRDRVLLLHTEQGFGDVIQFCRYAPLVPSNGHVILEVPRPLARLLSGLARIHRIVTHGDQLPAFDLHCPLLSLPRAFGTRLETIPAEVPYLRAEPHLVGDWQKRVANIPGLRVGLVWASNPSSSQAVAGMMDRRRRSITLAHFAELSKIPGLALLSLQKGEAALQTRSPPPRLVIRDWTDELVDFADTAALIEALDLVISIDTSVAHLAGALGKPVWLLNRFDTCWRWMLGREDCPWYPTLRQFRQPAPGDWEAVVRRVTEKLAALVLRRSGSGASTKPEG